jgi:hypothetical protein
MTRRVPLAEAEAPLLSRRLPPGVTLLLVVLAFVPDPAAPGVHWELLVLGVVLALLFDLASRRLAYPLAPNALVIRWLLARTALRTFGCELPADLTRPLTFGPDALPRVRAAARRGAAVGA